MSTNSLSIQASAHSIKSVTVFKSSRAEVVRKFPIILQKGLNKLEINGLPSNIYAVRTSGLGPVARIDDFLCTVGRDKSAIHDKESSSEIVRALIRKKESLESEKNVRAQELALLNKYSQTLTGEHVSPSELTKFLHTFVEQSRQIVQASAELDEKIVQIGREIDHERTTARKGDTMSKIEALITSDEDISVALNVIYIVKDCSWDATYELRATTENGKPSSSVTLHYLATVKQRTGEDWTNAVLTLSTNQTDWLPKALPRIGQYQIRQAPPRGNLFGPPSKGSLFGPAAQNNTMTSGFQQQNVSGNLFSKGSLFGPAAQNNTITTGLNQQQAVSAPVRFGQSSEQTSASNSTAAFGSSGGLFGQSIPAATTGLFGSSTNGGFGGGGFAGSVGASSFATAGTAPPPPAQDATIQETPFGAAFAVEAPEQSDLDSFEEVLYEEGPSENNTQPTVVVKETPLSMNFSVSEAANIPSDGLGHQVTLAVIPFQAKVSHITVPRIDPRIYLQCDVKNTSEYKLLQGSVSVIIDDSYMSTTFLSGDINPGDNFVCLLGNDPATNVVYTRSSKTVRVDGGAFAEDHNITTYTQKVSIYNKHSFDINDLLVYDGVPTCQDNRVKVILRKPEGLAEAKNGVTLDIGAKGLKVQWADSVEGKGGREDGNLRWAWTVAGGETVTMLTEYEVKVPRGINWVINHIPNNA